MRNRRLSRYGRRKRCKWGKLKRPIGRRRCRSKPRKRTRRRRGAVRLPFILAGLATVGIAAAYWGGQS
jgi:hypothetical protein